MIQPKIQEIFIPTSKDTGIVVRENGTFIVAVERKSLITFIPEEFETFKREFGKELLKKAAGNANMFSMDDYTHETVKNINCEKGFYQIDKQSITKTLDSYLEQNKI